MSPIAAVLVEEEITRLFITNRNEMFAMIMLKLNIVMN